MTLPFAAPSPEEHTRFLDDLAPLPISGSAWPGWVKAMAWLIVAVLAIQIARVLALQPGHVTQSTMGLIVLFCFVGLAVVAFYMQRSVTTIDERGLRQTWITKREVAWDDIQYAKFVPLLLSKRLVVFTLRGRPLVFQCSTHALHIAFARISLVYRSRK